MFVKFLGIISLMSNFWKDLKRPFTVLAPMEGVTDYVFREIINEIGRPDVFFTEFTNVEGLNSKGAEKVEESLRFDPHEAPIVAQLWGKDIGAFTKSAKLCQEKGFSGIDINMGCPDRVIVNRGSCAALIKNPKLAGEIIEATKKGAGDLPVSVKTRIGFNEFDLSWIKFVLTQNINVLTVHLRTVAELSKVPAHWDLMTEIIKLRDEIAPNTLIIGNGDLKTYEEIDEKFEIYKCDGFMIGRGIFQNPWVFNRKINIEKITTKERLDLFLRHIDLFDATWSEKNPAFLKKFCKTYLNNFSDAATTREKIMECVTTQEMREVLKNCKTNH